MTIQSEVSADPKVELRHVEIPAGEARVGVFTRTYAARVEEVWDACTNPDRLGRWYVPVTGDLELGGKFQQAMMGSGKVVRCKPPNRLTVSLGDGVDQVDLYLSEGASEGQTVLELHHATTVDQHEIEGQIFDAVFCMGGGYFPRLLALDLHLRGELPADYDPLTFFQRADMRPSIDRGSAAMDALLGSD